MFGIFGKRKVETTAAVVSKGRPPIVVPRSVYDGADPADLVLAVVNYVNAMFQHGQFQRDELPRSALMAYHSDFYLAQVANGGHGQFVGNSGWVPVIVEDIRLGLQAMRAGPYAGIFTDLVRLIESDKARAKTIADGGGFGEIDPAIKALDDRFFAQDCYKTLTPAIAAFLRGLPELEVVADASYSARMNALFAANPQLHVRRAQALRDRFQHNITDPVQVAARLLAVESVRLPFRSISHANAATAPDGREGMAWLVTMGEGRARMFLFPDAAILCDSYLASGELITDDLHNRQKAALEAGDLTALDQWSQITHKEVARVPAQLIEDMIAEAKSLPVITAGVLLAKRLGEEMTDLSPGFQHSSGALLWLMETRTRAGWFGFQEDGVKLIGLDGTMLASLSLDELRAAMAFERGEAR